MIVNLLRVAGVGVRYERNPGVSFAALCPTPATQKQTPKSMSAYFLVGAMFQAFVFWRFRLEGGTLRFWPGADTRTAGGVSHRMLV